MGLEVGLEVCLESEPGSGTHRMLSLELGGGLGRGLGSGFRRGLGS